MKYLLLNKNKQVISNNGEIFCETLKDEILQITNINKTEVKQYTKAQIADENLIPENIVFGKNVLGVIGKAKSDSYSFWNRDLINYAGAAEYVRSYMFQEHDELETIFLPKCSAVGRNAFYQCGRLQNVSLPMCSSIGLYAFYYCPNLTTISLPMCNYIDAYAFQSCSNLRTISLPMCSFIGAGAFKSCSKFTKLYLNVQCVPQLQNVGVFESTPFSRFTYLGYGSIYVPASLYEAFCSATNWATYSARIVSYF